MINIVKNVLLIPRLDIFFEYFYYNYYMKRLEKMVNFVVLLLIGVMFFLKVIDKDLFIVYDNVMSYIIIVLVILGSVYFSIKLKFIQINLRKIIGVMFNSGKGDLKALFMSLGAKIGVGSIVGITLAIITNGPGVLLWIWIISLLSSVLTYCETYLGVKYKNKDNNSASGGSFYYIKNGVGNKNLSYIYAVVLIFVYVIGFVGIQSNTIVKSINHTFSVNSYFIIGLVVLVIGIIIFNGLGSVIDFISKLVPIMCVIYLGLGIYIIVLSSNSFIYYMRIIVSDGLCFDSAIRAVMILGLKRGIFATESGLGTSSLSTSISENNPHNQGLFQILGVHFISLVVIFITGFIVIGNMHNYVGFINGIDIMMEIFNGYLGIFGKISLLIIVILFAVSTIVSGYYYGIKGFEFLKGKLSKLDCFLFKGFIILFVFLGSVVESSIIWGIVDSLVLILLGINIYSLVKLRREIK